MNKMTYKELKLRALEIEKLSRKAVIFSNQYGMCFLLNEEGGIILNLTPLLTDDERLEARKEG